MLPQSGLKSEDVLQQQTDHSGQPQQRDAIGQFQSGDGAGSIQQSGGRMGSAQLQPDNGAGSAQQQSGDGVKSGQQPDMSAERAGAAVQAVTADAQVLMDVVKDTLANAPGAAANKIFSQPEPQPVLPQEQSCQVMINGEPILLQNKKEFIFVDIFDHYLFDLTQSRGRMLITQVNGEDAQYTQTLHPGDRIDIYWKED